jgi:hypothetical protein
MCGEGPRYGTVTVIVAACWIATEFPVVEVPVTVTVKVWLPDSGGVVVPPPLLPPPQDVCTSAKSNAAASQA